MSLAGERAGAHYAELVLGQLQHENERKQSIEQRSIAVISTAGTLVALLFALGAVITQAKSFEPPQQAILALTLALACYVASALGALRAITVRPYQAVKTKELTRLLEERFWEGRPVVGERRAAEARIKVLIAARQANAEKASALKTAVWLEVTAIVATSIAMIIILLNG